MCFIFKVTHTQASHTSFILFKLISKTLAKYKIEGCDHGELNGSPIKYQTIASLASKNIIKKI